MAVKWKDTKCESRLLRFYPLWQWDCIPFDFVRCTCIYTSDQIENATAVICFMILFASFHNNWEAWTMGNLLYEMNGPKYKESVWNVLSFWDDQEIFVVFVTWCGKFSTLAKDFLWEWDLLCDFNRTFCSEFDTRKFFLMPLMSELMIVQHTKHQQQCVHFSSLSPSCTSNRTKQSLPKTKSCTNNN